MQNIELNLIPSKGQELADRIHCECHFCEKIVPLYPYQRELCERLAGDIFYCDHCLRHDFNTKSNRHILILTFRPIIAFFYYKLFLQEHKLYYSQIEDYIELHRQAGLLNPVFNYDPESFLWFVDFNKVGKAKKKVHVEEILKTTINILACFNLTKHISVFKTDKLYAKYNEAITKFYSDRYRPAGKKLLVPTLKDCGGICDNKNIDYDSYKLFTHSDLVFHS